MPELAKLIDHSLLRPELTRSDMRDGCALAARHQVASVCVKPCDVATAVQELDGCSVPVGTVVGFPHGSSTTATKLHEAREALQTGASEIDMVVNIAALRGNMVDEVEAEVAALTELTHAHQATMKVILENSYLTDDQIVVGSRLTERAGADFVKTSTGFAATGATVHDLRLMLNATSGAVHVKAAGGVRTLDRLLGLIALGVTRFGATATEQILANATDRADAEGCLPLPLPPEDDEAPSGY